MSGEADEVARIPYKVASIDAMKPNKGPAMETSNNAFRFLGNPRKRVMAPYSPI